MLFPSVPSYWNHKSLVYKNRKFVHDREKKGSTTNRRFSTTIKPLRTSFNFIKFYWSVFKVLYLLIGPGKVNITHEDIIFAAPKFGFSKRHISNNKHSFKKTDTTIRLVLSKTISA